MSIGIRRRDLITAAALAAARSRRAAAQAVQRLRVTHTDPGLFGPVHQRIKQRFAQVEPGIELSFEGVVRDYDEQVRALLRLGLIGEQPDVAFVGINRIKLLARRGLGQRLDAMIAGDRDWDAVGLAPSALSVGAVEGAVHALPFAISVPVIFYNADLVRRAGGDPDRFPTTWPEINTLARRIAALGPPITGGFFAYDTTGNWTFIALVESLGGKMMRDDDRTIAFDGAEGMQALEILAEFGAAAGMAAMTRDQARQAFGAGTMGILVDSSSGLPGLRRSASPQLALRAAPLPIPHPAGRLPAGGAAAMILARDAAKQAAAWRYVKFTVGPIGQSLLVPGTGYMTSNRVALRDPELLGRYYDQNPLERVAADQADRLTTWFSFPGDNSLRISDAIRGQLEAVATGRRAPAAAMVAMVAEVTQLLRDS